MGREIVRQESPKELGERSRLWNHEDSFSVLKGKFGTRKIRGLVLDMRSNVPLEGDAFSRMSNLQLLQISHVQLFGNYENFPKGLRWLHWSHFPLERIPKDFTLDMLVSLEMPYSCLKTGLNGTKGLHESYTFCTYVLGSKMPNRFSLKNVGSSISFTMPSDANFRTQGLSICSIYALPNPGTSNASSDYDGTGDWHLHTIISNATKHLKWSYCPEVHGIPRAGEDLMWLSYWKFEDQLEGGNEMNISVASDHYQVEEVGIHLVYKEAEEKKSTHPYGNAVPGFCNGDCEYCENFPVPADPASTRVIVLGTHPADCTGCPRGYLEYHHGWCKDRFRPISLYS